MLKWVAAVGAALVLAIPAAALAGTASHERALLHEMNLVRGHHGLHPFHADPRLQRAARSHTREMLATDDFTHGAFASRMAHFAVRATLAGENLAWGIGSSATAQGIVAAWLASPEHRANLLRPGFSRVGVGDLVGPFLGHRDADVVTADFAG